MLSVVMAVRDGERYVRDAIASVLAQTVSDFEFIIVDDASTDGTPAILRQYQQCDARVRVLRNATCLGPYPSANRGILEARGEVIARHDADDVSPPARFRVQLDAMCSSQNVVLVTGAFQLFGDRTGTGRPPAWQPRLEWELLFRNIVGAGAHVMFPRVVAGRVVSFPERFRYAEDYGLWCTLCRLGRVVCPDDIVYHYRQHPQSITRSQKADQHACLAAIRREYQRQFLDGRPDSSALLARFWTREGDRLRAAELTEVGAALADLRAQFLADVESRYGSDDRRRLDSELDLACRERLGYWLYRSIRVADREASKSVLAMATRTRQTMKVSKGAVKWAAKSALAKAGLLL